MLFVRLGGLAPARPTRQMLSIVGERERTHLVLQYVTMCIQSCRLVPCFFPQLNCHHGHVTVPVDIGILLLYIYNYAHLVFKIPVNGCGQSSAHHTVSRNKVA